MYIGIFIKLVVKKLQYFNCTTLTLESVSSAHFCTSQNVSIRALATLFKVSSELLASCLTSSPSITGRAVTTSLALAPSRSMAGKRSWSARAQPFLHRASSSEDFCFSMSLKQRRRAIELKSLQKSTCCRSLETVWHTSLWKQRQVVDLSSWWSKPPKRSGRYGRWRCLLLISPPQDAWHAPKEEHSRRRRKKGSVHT